MNTTLTLKQRFKLSRFIRGEQASTRAITLSHRRIFILPTQRGLVFFIFIGLLITLAFVYNNNLAYLLGFLLVSVFVVSTLHTFKGLSGLVISTGKHEPVFAGESAVFAIRINNPANYPRINVQLKAHDASIIQTDIAPHKTALATLSIPTTKRGHQALSTVTVFSYFPLGLLRAWSPVNFDDTVLVYPKPADTRLPLPETYSSKQQQGQTQAGDDEFYQCQIYQPGDPIRQIHWQAFAKQQGLLSKKYSGAASAEIWLDLIVTPGYQLEDKLSQMCRWVIDAGSSGLSFGLRLPGVNYRPDNSRSHLLKCLEALALFED